MPGRPARRLGQNLGFRTRMTRHDAFDAVIEGYAPLNLVLLHKPENKDFLPLYEQARRQGSALACYSNSAPASEPPTVTQWGFKPAGGR